MRSVIRDSQHSINPVNDSSTDAEQQGGAPYMYATTETMFICPPGPRVMLVPGEPEDEDGSGAEIHAFLPTY
jgi:hypothetical protein